MVESAAHLVDHVFPEAPARLYGFSLHAASVCEAHQRSKMERLCRYITRPPVAAVASGASIQQGLMCRVNWPREWFGCASGGAPLPAAGAAFSGLRR